MPSDLVQELLEGSDDLTATLHITGSVTVTAGNDIFVLIACENNGNIVSVVDDLGNTYTILRQVTPGSPINPFLYLAQAHDIVGGTLGEITISMNTGLTQIVATSAEFSGVIGDVTLGANDNHGFSDDAPSGLQPNDLGLHFFAACDTLQDLGGVVCSTFTPPPGYAIACEFCAVNGVTGHFYYGAHLCYFVGQDSGTKTGSLDQNVNWVTTSLAVEAETPPPIGCGVSFDGVTIRS